MINEENHPNVVSYCMEEGIKITDGNMGFSLFRLLIESKNIDVIMEVVYCMRLSSDRLENAIQEAFELLDIGNADEEEDIDDMFDGLIEGMEGTKVVDSTTEGSEGGG